MVAPRACSLDEPRERLRRDVLDVALAAAELLDALGVDLDEDDTLSGLREHLSERHPDVAGADDRDVVRGRRRPPVRGRVLRRRSGDLGAGHEAEW